VGETSRDSRKEIVIGMRARYKKQQFVVGDLVYYRGFEIFERHPPDNYVGIVVGEPSDAYASGTYYVFWFKSGLTTRMHCDNMTLVYETERAPKE